MQQFCNLFLILLEKGGTSIDNPLNRKRSNRKLGEKPEWRQLFGRQSIETGKRGFITDHFLVLRFCYLIFSNLIEKTLCNFRSSNIRFVRNNLKNILFKLHLNMCKVQVNNPCIHRLIHKAIIKKNVNGFIASHTSSLFPPLISFYNPAQVNS